MKTVKKINIFYELMFTLGMITLTGGLSLMVRSQMGISVASSMPYVISLRFSRLTFGTWSYLVQGFLILLLVLIVRRVKISYLLSFFVSVIFGLLLDLFGYLTSFIMTDQLVLRLLYFAFGISLLSFGIAAVIYSKWPPIPFDLFVKELALHTKFSFKKTKTIFDLSCLAFSTVFLLVFVQQFAGIGPGTVISAILNGTLVGLWLKLFSLRLTPRYLFKPQKVKV